MGARPVHVDDMCQQLEALFDAARTPANIVNWGGDEVVTVQEWCAMVGGFSGKQVRLKTEPVAGATHTAGSDQTKRKSITGPGQVVFRDAFPAIYDARTAQRAETPPFHRTETSVHLKTDFPD